MTRVAEALLFASGDTLGLETVRSAGLKNYQAGLLLGAPHDPCACCVDWVLGKNDVTEFLIFIAEGAFFDAPVQRGPLHARRKVAPIGFDDGAGNIAGTRRCDVPAEIAQPTDQRETFWRSGLDGN